MAEVTGAQIIAAIHAAAPEAPAVVEQTGGGTATVIVGTTDPETGRGWLSVGPGWYHWSRPLESGFELDGMSIGPDNEESSDSAFVEQLDDITRYVAHKKETQS